MAGIHATDLGLGCIAFGGLIHFFCLASVAWMSIEATNMYFMFVKVFNVDINHFMWKASLIGWGKCKISHRRSITLIIANIKCPS